MLERQVSYQMPDDNILKGAESTLASAKSYQITSPEMAEAAGEDLKSIKAKYKALDEQRKSITKPLDDAKKAVMDLFRNPLEYLEQAESILKRSLIGYQQEELRKAREAQAKAEEAARKERERLEAQAEKAEASGKVEKAEAIREQVTMTTADIVTSEPVKIAGISTRFVWKAEVTDKRALVEAALTRPDLMALLLVDESALNKLATALKENLLIAGVKAYSVEVMSSRAA